MRMQKPSIVRIVKYTFDQHHHVRGQKHWSRSNLLELNKEHNFVMGFHTKSFLCSSVRRMETSSSRSCVKTASAETFGLQKTNNSIRRDGWVVRVCPSTLQWFTCTYSEIGRKVFWFCVALMANEPLKTLFWSTCLTGWEFSTKSNLQRTHESVKAMTIATPKKTHSSPCTLGLWVSGKKCGHLLTRLIVIVLRAVRGSNQQPLPSHCTNKLQDGRKSSLVELFLRPKQSVLSPPRNVVAEVTG